MTLKAYIVRWSIANDMEAVVLAESATDALARFDAGDVEWMENTGNDWRCRQPVVRRFPDEDPE